MTWREQYSTAHQLFQRANYPTATKDFGCVPTSFPDVTKANGLTRAIEYFIKWNGFYANRINTIGMRADKKERQESGNIITVKRFVKSARKGTADLHCIINGKHVSIEIKIGRDTQKDKQKQEQARIISAGGIYLLIHTIEEFMAWYQMNIEIWK